MSGHDDDVKRRAARLAIDASALPVEGRVFVVAVLLGSEPLPVDPDEQDDVDAVVARIRGGALSNREIERVAASIAARTPPRDREERNSLIRQMVRRHAATNISTSAAIRWVTLQAARFVAGADWRSARHQASCPFPDERRTMLWRILKYGDLPGRSSLYEILESAQ